MAIREIGGVIVDTETGERLGTGRSAGGSDTVGSVQGGRDIHRGGIIPVDQTGGTPGSTLPVLRSTNGRNMTPAEIEYNAGNLAVNDAAIEAAVNAGTLSLADARAIVNRKDELEAAGQRPWDDSVVPGPGDFTGGLNGTGPGNLPPGVVDPPPPFVSDPPQMFPGLPNDIVRAANEAIRNLQVQGISNPPFSRIQQDLQMANLRLYHSGQTGSFSLPQYDPNALMSYIDATLQRSPQNVTTNDPAGVPIQGFPLDFNPSGTQQPTQPPVNEQPTPGGTIKGPRGNQPVPGTTVPETLLATHRDRMEEIMRAGGDLSPEVIQAMFPGLTPAELAEMTTSMGNLERDIFGAQGLGDVQLRGVQNAFGQGFGNFSPVGQRALNTAFQNFREINPITNFFNQQELGQGFSGYLGGTRPTSAQLSSGLENILSAFRASPDINEDLTSPGVLFRAYFNDPNQALATGTAPFVQGVAPRMQNAVRNVLADTYGSRFASNPTQFDDINEIANLFDRLRNAGFF